MGSRWEAFTISAQEVELLVENEANQPPLSGSERLSLIVFTFLKG
jgi:hypothetical protein